MNSIDQIIKERMLNYSTENGMAGAHQFFYESKIDDNLQEDIHSFIEKHRKERNNVKDNYLSEERTSKCSQIKIDNRNTE
jgi:uncharacterized lipoprotein YddW (UPF0748 family)